MLSQNQGQILHQDPELLHLRAWSLAGWARPTETVPYRSIRSFYSTGNPPPGRLTPWNGKKSSIWTVQNNVNPAEIPISNMMNYMLPASGSALSSLKVPLAAIAAWHAPMRSHSVFLHLTMSRFLKGLLCTFCSARDPTPMWDLNVMVLLLKEPSFEALSCH